MDVVYLTSIVSRIKYMLCGLYHSVFKKLFVSRFGEVCQPEPYLRMPGRYVYVSLGSSEFIDFVRELYAFWR